MGEIQEIQASDLEGVNTRELDHFLENIFDGYSPSTFIPQGTERWRLGIYCPKSNQLFQGDNLSQNHNAIVSKYMKEMPTDDKGTQGVAVFDSNGSSFIAIDTARGSTIPETPPEGYQFYIHKPDRSNE